MPDNSDKDKTIALQAKKIEELTKKISVLEQEIALLNADIMREITTKK